MKFGSVDTPESIDFTLPKDHSNTAKVFKKNKRAKKKPDIYIGCAKWNKQDLKGFYPPGTKDELTYYSRQFNCIELNATFYRIFSPEQFKKWREKTAKEFKFFPKISQEISHYKQLNNFEETLDQYLDGVSALEEKLGTVFLQLNDRFAPNRIDKLRDFIEKWPVGLNLAVEVRNEGWFKDSSIANEFWTMLEAYQVTNILVDTAGRRDMLHMRMTTATPFIRYVGANHESDYHRLDDWVERIGIWINQGMQELHFFIHQNLEKESPLLSAHLIEKLNETFGYDIIVPQMGQSPKLHKKRTS